MKTSQKNVKNSGIEWIGEIPSDWKLVKVKHLFVIGRGRVIPTTELIDDGKYPVYSSQTINDGCMGYINTYDFDGDFLTWTTDGVYAGSVFKRSGKFNCTNVCGTLKCKVIDVDIDYLWYAIDYCSNYNKRTDINGAKIMNNEMAKIVIALPDYEYQKKVSNYLSDKCKNISRLIKIEEQQIEKLKEYKQSIITEVVTKGLDKNVELKDSGVEWIGKIPNHWKIVRIKNAFTLNNERTNETDLEKVNLISLYTDKGVIQHSDLIETTGNKAITAEGYKIVKKKDIVVNIILCWMGAIGMSEYDGVTSPAYDIYTPKNHVVSKYYHYLFRTSNFNGECFRYGRGIMLMRWRTYSTEFTSIHIPYPNLKEQERIVEYLDVKCNDVDKLIDVKQKRIEKLNEYKKSLIYEYVTGKKEV